MKTRLLLGMFCSATLLTSAQSNQTAKNSSADIPMAQERVQKTKHLKDSEAKGGDDVIVYWSEDFSNGLDGQSKNGSWTAGGDQADLWFHTYPSDMEDGYDPASAMPEEYQDTYGLFLPNWADDDGVTLESTTAENGCMMIDVDRWNSTATDPEETGSGTTTSNPCNSFIVSPSFDLTGVENAAITFFQDWRSCCNDYSITMDFSTDGGATWLVYDLFELYNGAGNLRVDGLASINISDVLIAAEDLSDCRIKFEWDPILEGSMSHYYLILDDITVASIPDNDLVIGERWSNKWFDELDQMPDAEYISYAEYENQPSFVIRPFNFACEVTNAGTQIQTGVQLMVTFNSPDEAVGPEIFYSDPIELESGASDTLRAYDVIPEMWLEVDTGLYEMNFEVIQNEDENSPGDNIGANRFTRISDYDLDGSVAIMQNGRNNISHYPFAGEDLIRANRMVFAEIEEQPELVITHVEFILQSGSNVQTQVGEICFVNVRKGSVLEEESDENVMFRYFEDDELEYTVEEESLSGNDYGMNWITYELPAPVLIEPHTVYQGEIEIPAVGEDVIFLGLTNLQETYTSVFYDFNDVSSGPQGWWYDGGGVNPMIRFRLDFATNVPNVSYESGIKLTQNYPNPFDAMTTIQFQLDETSDARLEVYDISGKLVRNELLGIISAMSAQIIQFDRMDLAPGVYTYSIVASNERVTRKMTVK